MSEENVKLNLVLAFKSISYYIIVQLQIKPQDSRKYICNIFCLKTYRN